MSSRTLLNLMLALLLAGLALFAFYEPGKEAPPAPELLTALNAAEINKLNIANSSGKAIALVKQQGQWHMTSPYQVAADSGRLEQLLGVVSAQSLASYAMTQVDANQLQLDSPQLILRINDNTALRFGTTDSLQGRRYVQVGNRVHLIVDRYTHLAGGAASRLVSPRLLPAASTITQLALPTLTLQHSKQGWQTSSTDHDSTDELQAFIDQWQNARALSVTGLDASAPVDDKLTIGTPDGEISFNIQRTGDEIILQRPELGLAYHFNREAGQRLLQLAPKD
jgi:hypothetical protein